MSSADFVLYEEEFRHLEEPIRRLPQEANAKAVFLIDKNGQQIPSAGEVDQFDTTSLASLTAGNEAETDGLATLIGQVEALVAEQGAPAGFDAARWFREWMKQPVPALGGRRPVELLDTREGQQIVSGLLEAIRAGAYL